MRAQHLHEATHVSLTNQQKVFFFVSSSLTVCGKGAFSVSVLTRHLPCLNYVIFGVSCCSTCLDRNMSTPDFRNKLETPWSWRDVPPIPKTLLPLTSMHVNGTHSSVDPGHGREDTRTEKTAMRYAADVARGHVQAIKQLRLEQKAFLNEGDDVRCIEEFMTVARLRYAAWSSRHGQPLFTTTGTFCVLVCSAACRVCCQRNVSFSTL